MKAVNLLPADRVVAKPPSRLAPVLGNPIPYIGGTALLGTLTGVALLFMSATTNVGTKQAALARLDDQIAKLPAPTPPPSTGVAADSAARSQTVASIASLRLPWDGFLDTLSRVTPEDVWLTTLNASFAGAAATVQTSADAAAAAAAAAAAPTTTTATSGASEPPPPAPAPVASTPSVLTVTGYTYSQDSVARMLRRLTLVPWLSDINLVSSSKTTIGDKSVFLFTVGATVIQQTKATA